ncbi:MAG: dTDP-4-dehydrorhamnose reductase [Vitreimonas sp.]
MKIIVIGNSGQLARALVRRSQGRVASFGRPRVDLRNSSGIDLIKTERPDVVINAAAHTAVDKAETEYTLAFRLNAEAPGEIAAAAQDVGAAMIQVSTDYVFSGEKASPYVEHDAVSPINVYGASKLAGEQRVVANNERAMVLRTSWVYGAQGGNFVRTMLRLAKSRGAVRVVSDQFGGPTFVDDLADVVLALSEQPQARGLYHCGGPEFASWAGFAEEIFKQSAARGGPAAKVESISAAEFPTPAKRPVNSRLNSARLATDHGMRLRGFSEALIDCLDQISADDWSVE